MPEAAPLFKSSELIKIRQYKERIQGVEQGDLLRWSSPALAVSLHKAVLKRLTERLSEKQNLHYSVVAGWLRTRLSFSLLRSTLLCLRGTRRKKVYCENNIDAVNAARIRY